MNLHSVWYSFSPLPNNSWHTYCANCSHVTAHKQFRWWDKLLSTVIVTKGRAISTELWNSISQNTWTSRHQTQDLEFTTEEILRGVLWAAQALQGYIYSVAVALKSWKGCRAANNPEQCLNTIPALSLKHPSADAFCSVTPKISYRCN